MKKISKWGFSKNMKQSDMMILLAKRNARMLNTRVNTVFYRDGQPILDERLSRFSKRDFVKVKAILSPPKSK
jgi:hypothetical protein